MNGWINVLQGAALLLFVVLWSKGQEELIVLRREVAQQSCQAER